MCGVPMVFRSTLYVSSAHSKHSREQKGQDVKKSTDIFPEKLNAVYFATHQSTVDQILQKTVLVKIDNEIVFPRKNAKM